MLDERSVAQLAECKQRFADILLQPVIEKKRKITTQTTFCTRDSENK